MFYTYILYSLKCNRFYVGYSENIPARLSRHNEGKVTATRNCRPYELKASKTFSSEVEARREELRIKKQKNKKYIEWLLEGNWQSRPDPNRGGQQCPTPIISESGAHFKKASLLKLFLGL